MMCFGALPDRTRFDANPNLANVRAEIAARYSAAAAAFVADEDRIEFPGDDHWSPFKSDFVDAQAGRCGYCELVVHGSQFGDVEHFRPKGRVAMLDPQHRGKERVDLSTVVGRKALRTIGTGYWWCAYSWDNYLLSCAICNQVWKKDFFPVAGDPLTRARPAQGTNEQELLLYPFGKFDPVDHFAYELDGRIRGLTEQGIATIETVGLWRPSLVDKRRVVLKTLARLIDEMKTGGPELVRSNAHSIYDQGSIEHIYFPGMTRIFFQQQSGTTWEELTAMVEGLQAN